MLQYFGKNTQSILKIVVVLDRATAHSLKTIHVDSVEIYVL